MIISTFNSVFWLLFVVFSLLTFAFRFFCSKKDLQVKKVCVAGFYILVLVYFFVYKYQLSIDTEYSEIQALSGAGEFSWWTELPLNLCNISLILLPIAVLCGKRSLLSFVFFVSPLGALLALLMPSTGFAGYSLFLPRVCGFYLTHFSILFGGVIIYVLDLFRPDFKDIIPCFAGLFAVSAVVFVINIIIRVSDLSPFANYFFEMSPVDNPALGFFFKLIPVPGLYLIPIFIIVLLPYMYLVTFAVKKISVSKFSNH